MQYLEEGVDDEERVADAEEGGIGDGPGLFVAVIKLGSIGEFGQSFEDVALVEGTGVRGRREGLGVREEGVGCSRGGQCLHVHIAHVQLQLLERELAILLPILALEVIGLCEVAFELAGSLALHTINYNAALVCATMEWECKNGYGNDADV